MLILSFESLSMSAFLETGKSQLIVYYWSRCWLRGSRFWQKPKFFGGPNQVGQRLDLHLLHDPGAMDFDGFFHCAEFKSDPFVRHPARDQSHHFVLTDRQLFGAAF